MIKNIVFDMGQVLVKFSPFRFISHVTSDGEDTKLLHHEIFLSVEWIMCDRGEITPQQMEDVICARLPQRLRDSAKRIFHDWSKQMPLIPGMEALARDLKALGYRVYLLSNTCTLFHSFRKNIPALQYFDGEFISADWHLLKPEVEIFRNFYHHYRLNPAECFFLDDSPANIEGAARTGMLGYVFAGDAGAARARLEEILGRSIPIT